MQKVKTFSTRERLVRGTIRLIKKGTHTKKWKNLENTGKIEKEREKKKIEREIDFVQD